MNGFNSTLTYNGIELNVVSWHWRQVNPYSFLNDFDRWFAFECYVHGLRDSAPEGVRMFFSVT